MIKPRKPKDMCIGLYSKKLSVWEDCEICGKNVSYVSVNGAQIDSPNRLRKIAAWLLRAADYMEHRKRKNIKVR